MVRTPYSIEATTLLLCRLTPGSAMMDTFWCNAAMRKRAGRLYTYEEQLAVLEALPQDSRDGFTIGLTSIHHEVMVRAFDSCRMPSWSVQKREACIVTFIRCITRKGRSVSCLSCLHVTNSSQSAHYNLRVCYGRALDIQSNFNTLLTLIWGACPIIICCDA